MLEKMVVSLVFEALIHWAEDKAKASDNKIDDQIVDDIKKVKQNIIDGIAEKI